VLIGRMQVCVFLINEDMIMIFSIMIFSIQCWCVAAFRRQKVKDLSKDKREKLSDNLLYAKFNRDVAEVRLIL